ncbi:MAG: inositol monophosphatase family protein [Candidatus Hydrogenedentota bacterium]
MTQEKASTRKQHAEPAAEAERMAKSRPAGRAVKDDGKTDSAKKAAGPPGGATNPDASKGPSHSTSKGKTVKPLPREFLMDVAAHVRDAVRPAVRDARGREIVGSASSGDATFKLDQIAEKALLSYLRRCDQPVAYYSEDAGYTTFSSGPPQYLLVVDPVDGSRAAKSGFESCVVCVAATRVIERPQLSDVDNACVMEIAGDRIFYAERGKGSRIYREHSTSFSRPKPSKNTDLEMVSWSMTVPARPAELVFPTAARLIDLTSLKGGFFACNSTSFSLTRLLTNQLDACVDFANRFYRDIPDAVQDQFINAGRGIVLGMAPYDLAASLLIAEEAGCVVTDAYGDRLDEVLMLDSTVSNQRSLIAAANAELYEKLMQFFDTRIQQFEHLLERRAALAQG